MSNTYEGIYPDFASVPGRTKYNTQEYLNSVSAYCEHVAKELVGGRFVPQNPRNKYNNLLAMLAGMRLEDRPRVTILDIGGGLGQSYLLVASAIADSLRKIDYFIADAPEAFDWFEPRNFYPGLGLHNVQFIREMEQFPQDAECDILNLASTLQYVEDPDRLFALIDRIQPKYVLITHTPVMIRAATFVTAQLNMPPHVLPCRVFNTDHLVQLFRDHKYRLLFHSADGSTDTSNFPNFPPEYQENRSGYFAFSRSDWDR